MEQVLIQMSESRWRVLQPAIYLVSVLPALVCGLVFETEVPLTVLIGLGSSVVLIQHAINVFNDETDWKKGADGEKSNSWYHFHQGNSSALKMHAWMSLFIGVCLGISMVYQTGRWGVLWVALPLVALGYCYNHSRWALSYTSWGEWVTGLCYGPGVFGCMAYVLTGQINREVILGSLAFSGLAVAVLLSHQPPQVLTDFAAGKNSFAVRYGVEKTYTAARILTLSCLLLIYTLFFSKEAELLHQFIFGGITVGLIWQLPKQLSPPEILKTVSIQIAFFLLFFFWGVS